MFYLKIILFQLIVISMSINDINSLEIDAPKKKNHCETLKNELSQSISNFMHCAFHNAEPVEYCRECGSFYLNQTITYKTLVDNKTCHDIYVDNDRLNIVQTIQSHATSLWNAGSCSECYNTTLDATTKYFAISNLTYQFGNLTETLDNCLRNDSHYSKCVMCKSAYDKVNLLYNEFKKYRGENICFDIKDSMNKTRIHWSKTLHCCEDRNSSEFNFYILTSFLSVLVFVFYIGLFVWGRNQEEYDQLNDFDSPARQNQDQDQNNQPSTSTSNTVHGESQYQSGDDELNIPPKVPKIRNQNAMSSTQAFLT